MTLPADEPARSRTQWTVIAVAALLAVLPARQAAASGWRFVALFGVGILLGATLHRFAFGFAYAYRRLIVLGDTRGRRRQPANAGRACGILRRLVLGQPARLAVARRRPGGGWLGVRLRPRFGLVN